MIQPNEPFLNQMIGKAIKMLVAFAIITASLFTMWTPANILTEELFSDAIVPENTISPLDVINAESTPEPGQTIGIIVGHHGYAPLGIPDPGAVCYDAAGNVDLQEVDLNLRIATLLKQELIQDGFNVVLLDETDERLEGFLGLAVISIHNDTCMYIDEYTSGFKVKAAPNALHPELAERLSNCMVNRYQSVTQMDFINYVSEDMSEYHAFEKFDPKTPSIIVETGYMLLDRKILTEQPDLIAKGLADGLRCYAYNEVINIEPTPAAAQDD